MQPRHGARVTLRLSRADAKLATYEAVLETSASTNLGRAEVTLADGAVELRFEPAPAEWLGSVVRALLRAEWRAHRVDAAWPRRITRWRPAPGEIPADEAS